MRIAVAAFALLVASAVPAHAQRPSRAPVDSATRAALFQARDGIWRAWFANDSAELARWLPPSVTAVEGTDGYEDRAAILAGSKAFATGGGKLTRIQFFDTEIVMYGNLAILHARYELTLDNQGQRNTRSGRATEVFVNQKGHWVNPFWHLD
jgi:hypothetical protein